MLRAMVGIGFAGLASGAAAQSGLIVNLSFDKTFASIGETFNAFITATWSGPFGSYLSSFNVDLIATGPYAQVNSVDTIAWNNPALGFTGMPASIDGASVLGLQAAQFSLIPPFDSSNPLFVTRINLTSTALDAGVLTYSVRTVAGAPAPFSVTGPGFSDPVVFFGEDAFRSASIGFPTPGVLGVAGLGALVAARRQRV